MKGEYVIKINGELITYTDYDDIPDVFDHIIKFNPDWPKSPHTQEDHDYMETFNDKLQRLGDIERNAGSD